MTATILDNNYKIITRISCPNELASEDGECEKRWDSEHCKTHYHFARRMPWGTVMTTGLGKPLCRYNLTGDHNICWDHENSKHKEVFDHSK
jgi:hypothetical protein